MTQTSRREVGRTMAEKIFSTHAGIPVRAGDVISAQVDAVMVTDGSGPLTLEYYRKMEGKSVFDASRILFVLDHYVPCPNDKVARLHDGMRTFATEGKATLFDLGCGICHQILPEAGHVRPGGLVIGGDSHSTTYGAFNCLGTGLGSSDIAAAMISGRCWFNVPYAYKIELRGSLPPHVSAKDAALHIVGLLGAAGAVYKSVEFCGDGIASLSLSGRMTLCNMMVETGAKCALMPCDAVLEEWRERTAFTGQPVQADADALYEKEIIIELNTLEPMIAKGHSVDDVVPLSTMAGTPVHMGVLGMCTNGRLEDLAAALDIMGDAPLAHGFELLVVPASRQVYKDASRLGYLERFVDKGAYILPPGCGPCCGSSPGIPSDGETVISTANRNFIGRMGNVKATILLASPQVVAAAAMTGRLCHPGGSHA